MAERGKLQPVDGEPESPARTQITGQQLLWLVIATVTVLLTVGVVLIAFHLREILAVIFLGVVVGITCAPVADFFARWKIPHAVSVLVIYSLLAGLATLFIWYAAPRVATEADSFLDDTDEFEQRYAEVADQYDLPALNDVRDYVEQGARSLAPAAARQALAVVTGLVYIVTIFVVALLYTTVKNSGYELVLSLAPDRSREKTAEVLDDMGRKLRGFIVGQLISMTVVGVATYIGLVILGVPFPFMLAVLAFLFELLPVLGPWLSAVPAVILALSESPQLAIVVAIFYLVLQQIESNIILPLVQRHQTEMPALIVLAAVLIGGAAMGILGALVALPLTVVLHTLFTEVFVPWRYNQIERSRARREEERTARSA